MQCSISTHDNLMVVSNVSLVAFFGKERALIREGKFTEINAVLSVHKEMQIFLFMSLRLSFLKAQETQISMQLHQKYFLVTHAIKEL